MRVGHIATLGIAAAGIVVGACSSPFNPQSSASYRLGVHLDTLAVNAASAGQVDRYRLLAYPIAALMENLAPSTVSMTVNGTASNFKAVVLELVGETAGSSPVPSDSVFVVAAWSDSNASKVIYVQMAQPDTLEDVADLADTVANPAFDSATGLAVAVTGATKHCRTFSLPLTNAAVTDFITGSSCAAGTASAAFTLYFTANATNPDSVISLASQPINAARLVLSPNTGGQERLRLPSSRIFRSYMRP